MKTIRNYFPAGFGMAAGRFGFDGDNEKTLEEIGQKFGVTRERIRQIQEIALAKLRRKLEALETVSVAE